VGLAAVVALLYQNYRAMAALGASIGSPDLPLYLAVVATWVLIFVLGFPIALSVLYFSRDTRLLASLPIAPIKIVAANAGLLYLYALPAAILVVVPGLVAAWSGVSAAGTGLLQYIVASALTVVSLPLVPLALSVLAVTALTRAVNLSRYRTGLEVIGMVFVVLLLVGFQLLLSRSIGAGEGDPAAVADALGSFVVRIQAAVPPARWYSRAYLPGSFSSLGLALAISVAAATIALVAVQGGYLRQLSSQEVTRTRRRRTTSGRFPGEHRPVVSLMMRELKLLTSNSTFLFESVGELLVCALILVMIRLATPPQAMDQVMGVFDGSDYLIPAATALLILFAGINSVSSAALSREGKTFALSLTLPLAGSAQVGAKVLTYLALFGSTFVVNSAIATWILGTPWWYALVISLTGLPFVWLIGVTTILIDIRRPLLDWNHPQQAVKQNLNVVLGMGIAIVSLAVTAAPAAIAVFRGAGTPVVLALGGGFAFVVAVIATRQTRSYADRRYHTAFDA